MRDARPDDPVGAAVEGPECGLTDAHCLLELSAPEEDPPLEEDCEPLGETATVRRRSRACLPSGDCRGKVDLIEAHQRGDLDDRDQHVDRRVVTAGVGAARTAGPGQRAIMSLLEQVRERESSLAAPLEGRNGPGERCEPQQRAPGADQVAAKQGELGESDLDSRPGPRGCERTGSLQLLRCAGWLARAHERLGTQDVPPVDERFGKLDCGEAVQSAACSLEIAPAELLAGQYEMGVGRHGRVHPCDLGEGVLERGGGCGRTGSPLTPQERERLARAVLLDERAAGEQQRLRIGDLRGEGAPGNRLQHPPGARLRGANHRAHRRRHRWRHPDAFALAGKERVAGEHEQRVVAGGAEDGTQAVIPQRSIGSGE